MKPKEPVIRHAFEQTATRLARLSLFAEAGEAKGYSYEVTSRQELLATDDILNLAIACRRLIDALALRDISFNRKVLALSPKIQWRSIEPRPTDLSLHETLNRIIHSSFAEVFSFSFQLQRHTDFSETYQLVVQREEYRIPPLLGVKSDRDPLSFCDLRDLCLAIDEVLDAASEAAGDLSIYLSEF